jgi:glycosyltransferase involved in cell wall biosynthesis
MVGRFAAYYASRFCCVSEDIAASVIDRRVAPRRKVVVVGNGIDAASLAVAPDAELRRELGIPERAVVVGTVGRLTEIKRQDFLLRGFARVALARADAHLLVVGDGPMRTELEILARTLGVSGRVHFAGYRADPERFYPLMDVFALTSRSEGMPLSVLEAWAAGKPVVATRVGGLPDLVEDGRTGHLVALDDVPGLASALGGVLDSPALAARMGAAGRAVVRDRFDVSVMAEAYQRLYADEVAAARPAR